MYAGGSGKLYPAPADRCTASRHRAAALRALACGHGVRWAADITGLPFRLVARVAAGYRTQDGRRMPDVKTLLGELRTVA